MMVVELNACHGVFSQLKSVKNRMAIKLNYPLSAVQLFFIVINLIY